MYDLASSNAYELCLTMLYFRIEDDHKTSSSDHASPNTNICGTVSDAPTSFEPSNRSSESTFNRIIKGKISRRRRKGINAACNQVC